MRAVISHDGVPPRPPRWLACRIRRPAAKARLICFPHSGGAAGEYLRWAEHLPDIEVWALQLPGRGSRIEETPFTRIDPLVHALIEAETFESPFAFFGHSLGALVAFEVTHALRTQGREQPCCLFLSACRAPDAPSQREPIHQFEPDALLAALDRSYGGIPREMADPELRELVLPSLRADLTIAETYHYAPRPAVDCPMVLVGGARDNVSRADLEAWRSHTTGAFEIRSFPGDHFYLRQEMPALLALVAQRLAANAKSPHAKTPAPLDDDFTAHLFRGRLRWDLITPFPEQTEEARRIGDEAVARMGEILSSTVDPEQVEREGSLPQGYLDALRNGGFFESTNPPELGGRGLSSFNVFRVLELAMGWSIPAGYVLAVHNGLGVGAIDRVTPEGPLRDFIHKKLADGILSTWADSEPSGASNARPATYAEPDFDESAYRIYGRKVFIANGAIAGLINVTATLREGNRETVRIFVVDTASPGFHIRSEHELMGFRGLPIHVLEFDGVRVPRERVLPEGDGDWRHAPRLKSIRALARMYLVVCPSSAIAKKCLDWSRDFAARRIINGHPLGEYEEIQRTIAANAADVFAIDSLVQYALRGPEGTDTQSHLHARIAAKNIASVTCWRVVDRTMSLFASEGLETARSKARRGVRPLPLERAFRDARGLRITGGVDFLVDIVAAKTGLLSFYYPLSTDAREIESELIDIPVDPRLSAPNRDHLVFLSKEAKKLARTALALSRQHSNPEELFARQGTLIALNRVVNEILTMSVVLARASLLSARGECIALGLADVYCTEARHRLADTWRHLDAPRQPDFSAVSRAWLTGTELDFLTRGVLPSIPGSRS